MESVPHSAADALKEERQTEALEKDPREHKILAEGADIGGEFEIDEVEVGAQLTAEGKIGFARR